MASWKPHSAAWKSNIIANSGRLARYPFYHAALGEFELRNGNAQAARAHFDAALAFARNPMERRFLAQRVEACGEAPGRGRVALGQADLASVHAGLHCGVLQPTARGKVMREIGYALRRLRGSPMFTIAATLTLAIAIGATASVFGVVDGVLLKAFPFRDPGRVLTLWETNPAVHQPRATWRPR